MIGTAFAIWLGLAMVIGAGMLIIVPIQAYRQARAEERRRGEPARARANGLRYAARMNRKLGLG